MNKKKKKQRTTRYYIWEGEEKKRNRLIAVCRRCCVSFFFFIIIIPFFLYFACSCYCFTCVWSWFFSFSFVRILCEVARKSFHFNSSSFMEFTITCIYRYIQKTHESLVWSCQRYIIMLWLLLCRAYVDVGKKRENWYACTLVSMEYERYAVNIGLCTNAH